MTEKNNLALSLKERIEEMAKAVESEALAAYSMAFYSARRHTLSDDLTAVGKELRRIADSLTPEKSP